MKKFILLDNNNSQINLKLEDWRKEENIFYSTLGFINDKGEIEKIFQRTSVGEKKDFFYEIPLLFDNRVIINQNGRFMVIAKSSTVNFDRVSNEFMENMTVIDFKNAPDNFPFIGIKKYNFQFKLCVHLI